MIQPGRSSTCARQIDCIARLLRGRAGRAATSADPAAAREALADCVEESERVITMLNPLMASTEAEALIRNQSGHKGWVMASNAVRVIQ